VRVPWTALLAHSYDIECPACHTGLEVSRYTRATAGFGGLAGALLATHLAGGLLPGTAWLMRITAGVLGFGFISAACVLIAGDLVVRPKAAGSSSAFPHSAK
jgi:hypothetical protein